MADYSHLSLAAVAGKTTTTAASLGKGNASLSGLVSGPTGPVPGAIVRIERLVDDKSAGTAVTTGADGTWGLSGIAGGRYRVRAWMAPVLAKTTPEVFFLSASEKRRVDMTLNHLAGVNVRTNIAPNPPVIGEPGNLAVQISIKSVGDDGIVRFAPLAGAQMQIPSNAGFTVESPNPVLSNSRGQGFWQVRCTTLGEHRLTVLVNTVDVYVIDVPDCVPVPPTTTTLAPIDPAPTTTAPGQAVPPTPSTTAGTATGVLPINRAQ